MHTKAVDMQISLHDYSNTETVTQIPLKQAFKYSSIITFVLIIIGIIRIMIKW